MLSYIHGITPAKDGFMFASIFILTFVTALIAAAWKKPDTVVTEPSEEWSFDPVDGPGWFIFTGEVQRD